MESQLGLALVGPTSCTSCLCRKKNPSTWADQEWSWAQRSKFLLRQMCKATCGRSPTEGVLGRSFFTNESNAFERIVGEWTILCTWSFRALYMDHYLSFLESEALSHSFSPFWFRESDVPFLFSESIILCLSLPCFSMLLWGLNLYHKGCIRTLYGRNAARYSEESMIPMKTKILPGKNKARTTRRITI